MIERDVVRRQSGILTSRLRNSAVSFEKLLRSFVMHLDVEVIELFLRRVLHYEFFACVAVHVFIFRNDEEMPHQMTRVRVQYDSEID